MSRPHPPLVLIVGADGFLSDKLVDVLEQKKLRVVQRYNFENHSDASYVIAFADSGGAVLSDLLSFASKNKPRFMLLSTVFANKDTQKCEELVFEHTEVGLNGRVVRLGDVYGPHMSLSPKNPLERLLAGGIHRGELKVSKHEQVYPVYVDDIMWGIEKCLFSGGTSGHVITLAGHAVTTFEVAHVLSSIKPGLVVVQDEGARNREIIGSLREGRDLVSWDSHTNLYEGFGATLPWLETHKPVIEEAEEAVESVVKTMPGAESFWGGERKRIEHNRIEHNRIEHNSIRVAEERKASVSKSRKAPVSQSVNNMRVLGIVICLFCFYFLLLPFIQLGLGVFNLNVASDKFDRREFAEISTWSTASGFWFKHAQKGLDRLAGLPFVGVLAIDIARQGHVLERRAQVVGGSGEVAVGATDLIYKVFGKAGYDVLPLVSNLSGKITSLEQNLAFLDAQTDTPNSELRARLRSVSQILNIVPGFLGQSGKKTYLVLVMDETELRPGGGYVGVYGLLTFDKGRLVSFDYQSTDMADSLLAGFVAPPGPIKEHLEENSWYLRDVAWSGDFSSTATRAMWFIDKELGIKVDGVLGLDHKYLRDLIAEVGPLDVQSVGAIDEKNLYQTFQSSRKSQAEVLIVRSVFETISKSSTQVLGKILEKSLKALDEKHFNIYLPDYPDSIAETGWGGVIHNATCKWQPGCSLDYLYFTEANLGINKANYFLERSFNLDVSFEKAVVLHRLTINLNNTGGKDWPGGAYSLYLKTYLPSSAGAFGAVIVDTAGSTAQEIQTQISFEKNKTILGGFVTVPAGQRRQIVLSWETPKPAILSEYAMIWQKQVGTDSDPVWITISGKDGHVLEALPHASLTSSGIIGYNTELTRDLRFNIKWQQSQ